MRLVKVTSKVSESRTVCQCGGFPLLHEAWADLDGEPFRAYYCKKCRPITEDYIAYFKDADGSSRIETA